MMKSAKEWAVGEVFIVRGASSECWKVEGKGGSSHFAVKKRDEGKTWQWALMERERALRQVQSSMRSLGKLLLCMWEPPAAKSSRHGRVGKSID